ncbi:MAG: hypothetical protein A3D28_00040 [Omnitrophica bacterium RIFCSPHIGHO2_02_FULL_63_14]|nr:MAG: hypothetical protein A3D28_00040 [Omnitrophica bacterium RIFCSPHIGHO2_02_FULL_63_14]
MRIKKKLTILNPQGLHARPASIFVKIANQFQSDVTLKKGTEKVNGKSIMGILMLAASQGSVVDIELNGPDAEEAMGRLEAFLTSEKEPDTEPLK